MDNELKAAGDNVKKAPRFEIIRDYILAGIRENSFQNGMIPGEVELAERFGVSRATVRRAVLELADRGILVRRRGYGTVVNQPHFTRAFFRTISFTADCIQNGFTPSTQTSKIEYVTPEKRIADQLELYEGEKSFKFYRVRSVSGDPVILEYNQVPGRYDFLRFSGEPVESLVELFSSKHGIKAHHCSSILSISYATGFEAETLRIKIGEPVFIVEGVCYSDKKLAMIYFKQIIASEKCKLDIGLSYD